MRRPVAEEGRRPRPRTPTDRPISAVRAPPPAPAAPQPRPNKFLSLAALVAGSLLAIRGATGHCAAKSLMKSDSHAPART